MLELFGIMTDTQATDVVTFDFKGTGVRCVVCGTIDYQMNFFLVHNVSKCSRLKWHAGIHMESTDINVKRTELYCLSIHCISSSLFDLIFVSETLTHFKLSLDCDLFT